MGNGKTKDLGSREAWFGRRHTRRAAGRKTRGSMFETWRGKGEGKLDGKFAEGSVKLE